MIYTVTLNPAIDREIFLENLSFNDVNRIESENYKAGGKGINISRILNLFNVPNKAIVLIGGSRGKKLEKILKKEKIDYIPIYIENNIRENISIISGKDKNEIRINESGPIVSEIEIKKIKEVIFNIEENSTVFLSGTVVNGLEDDIYFQIIEELNKNKIKSILDSDTEKLRFGLSSKPYIIKPNKEEFERFAKKVYNTQLELIEDLEKLNVDIKILTNASENLLVLGKTKRYEISPLKTNVKRTLGAGDCFLAIFYVYLEKYNDILIAAKYASAGVYLYLENRFNLKELDELSKKVKVKNLEVK